MVRTTDDNSIHKLLQHHDREITQLRSDVAGLAQGMASLNQTVHSIDSKFDRFIQGQVTQNAGKPGQVLDAVRTALSILSTMAFLTGATVAAIVYVSSNANNSDITLLKYQVGEARQLLERRSWAPEVRSADRR